MGFSTETYRDGDTEFDVIFTSQEGRCLGEVEGRDKNVIDIKKFRQLQDNILADIEREEIDEEAKAVLFGNAHRLTPPHERKQTFSDKCIRTAKKREVALVNTVDLFDPCRYLKHNVDPEYAELCRKAIFQTDGDIVKFPPIPGTSPISG